MLADGKTMDDILTESLHGFGLRAGAIALFGGATVVLAMLGVYGGLAIPRNATYSWATKKTCRRDSGCPDPRSQPHRSWIQPSSSR